MWIKRTPSELAAEYRSQQRTRIKVAVVAALLVTVLVTFFFGWGDAARAGRITVPRTQLLSRLAVSVPAGVVFGFVCYWIGRYTRRVMVCPQCETTKHDDGVTTCTCGGQFERMEAMKHVA